MKFFTAEWHAGRLGEEEEETTVENYRRHIEALRPHLSPEVQQLAFATDLHDGLLEEVRLDGRTRAIHVRMICGDLQRGYSTRTLSYRDVQWNENDIAIIRAIAVDPATEALCDEVDLVTIGLYEHRVLFSPYREWRIQFGSLEIRSTARDGRQRPDEPMVLETS